MVCAVARERELPEGEPSENAYYARVSAKLKLAMYLCLILTVAAALLFLFAYRSNITYENLRYLLRDVDEAGNAGGAADTIVYTASDTNFYLVFRGDLAVCSAAGVTLHRTSGGRAFSDEITFEAPVAEASEKYMVVYDFGGTRYYLYNSISRVYSGTADGPIYDCAVGDGGEHAVLTRSKGGGFSIRIYNKNFDMQGEITRGGYVGDIGYLDDGRLYLCETSVSGAALVTTLSLYMGGSDSFDCTVTADGFALSCGSIDGGFYLLTDCALYFFDKSGEKTFSTSFGTSEILLADASRDGVCVYVDENVSGADCAAYAFFADGKSLSAAVSRGARSILLDGRRICLLYEGRLTTVSDEKTIGTLDIADGGRKLLRFGGGMFVCFDDRAPRMSRFTDGGDIRH